MPLLTIDDLLHGDPAEVEKFEALAKRVSNLYEKFVAEDPGDGHKREPGIHASEVSGCERRMVYSLLKEERIDRSAVPWKRRFRIGHAIHDMFQKDFARMAGLPDVEQLKISFEAEVKVRPDKQELAAKWDIYSSCDGVFVISDMDDNPLIRIALEIKSESPAGYEKLKEPKPDHVEQAHVYMACLDTPFIWFLYYNKGNQNFTPSDSPTFFVKYDPQVWDRLESRFERMHILAWQGILPERREGVLCEFCAFSWKCEPKYLQRSSPAKVNNRWMDQ